MIVGQKRLPENDLDGVAIQRIFALAFKNAPDQATPTEQ